MAIVYGVIWLQNNHYYCKHVFYVSHCKWKPGAFAPMVRADGRAAMSVIMYDYVSH